MKRFLKNILTLASIAIFGMTTSCSDYKPNGYEELPDLPTVTDLKWSETDRVVTISWNYPATSLEIEGVNITVNGNNDNIIALEKGVTSYIVKGQPMQDEYMYTVKMRYKGSNGTSYVSPGQSVIAVVPFSELADVTNLKIVDEETMGRQVTFSWTLPKAAGITGVMIGEDGQEGGTVFEGSDITSATLKGQIPGKNTRYRVRVQYDGAYYSDGECVDNELPEMETRTGFLLLADSPAQLEDDDEKAAAAWYYDNYVTAGTGDFITIAQLPDIDFDLYGVIWIMVDRVGIQRGWQNLPAELVSSSTLDVLKAYTMNGGNLYLSKLATQLTVPLGIISETMPPNTFEVTGNGGEHGDIWSINPYLGWDFQGTDDFYDRTSHAIFEGITLEQVNDYPYASIPLQGPGAAEDNNCLWDINPYWNEAGRPESNCVRWFEVTTNSLVLATWGHVRDHCVAGIVDFNPTTFHGRCIANGFAAYEWNQNSGSNPYQKNIEKLTENILNYLK